MRTFAIRPLFYPLVLLTLVTSGADLSPLPGSPGGLARRSSSKEIGKGVAQSRTALYVSVGEELIQFGVDAETATLVRQSSVTLPAYVQEGWLHPSGRYFYIAWSNRGTNEAKTSGEKSGVTVFSVDSNGGLQPLGSPLVLISRPVYITGDIPGTHILVAFNDPSGIAVYSIAPDGTLSAEVKPAGPLDVGVYGHQVRVNPSNRSVILVTRGNKPANGKKEDPGALKVMGYHDGVLSDLASVAPGGGFGFQPRHLDFHPSKPWAYLTLEAQNKLEMYKMSADGRLSEQPVFVKDTVADPANMHSTQAASTVHVHPNGKFVYVGNRAEDSVDFNGMPVFSGGENSIGVFRIDQATGEPTLIQSADTHGFHPRTFSIDPSGRLLVVGNQDSLAVKEGHDIRVVSPGFTVFRIKTDGRLERMSETHMDTRGRFLYWVMFIKLRDQI
jgi:6-phosphogluconolactonase (cycloisomerase 2 family)